MSEQKIQEKLEKVMGIVKNNLVEYTHFLKRKIKLYEMKRQYNTSVYELGHQFYMTAKTGIEDIKVFAPSIERLRELEHGLADLKEDVTPPVEEQSPDTEEKP